MEIELLNDTVTEPVLNSATKRKKRHGVNRLFREGVPVDISSLTPEEKGFIFDYRVLKTGVVEIYMPFRLMDKALAGVVSKYKSYRTTGNYVPTHRLKERSLKDTRSCLQWFTLSMTDWANFVQVAELNEWKLVDARIELDYLKEQGESLLPSFAEVIQELTELRHVVEDKPPEEQRELLPKVDLLQNKLKEVTEARLEFFRLVDSSLKEERTLTEVVEIQEISSVVRDVVLPTMIDIQEIYRRVLSQATKVAKLESKPEWLRDLDFEIGRLAKHYQALKHLQVVGESLELNLSGVRIRLSPTIVTIEGDLSALTLYTKADTVQQKTTRKSRFKSLDIKKGDEN